MPKGDVARRNNAVKNNRSEHKKATRYTQDAAKANLILAVSEGHTIEYGLEKVGRGRSTYERWRTTDHEFRTKIDQAKALTSIKRSADHEVEKLDFVTWRQKYLKTDTPWHAQQWVDILEGREPRDIHPAQEYRKGKASRILINTPPFHGKTITVTVDYVTYRICMDPSFRVLLVSEGERLATDFLAGIKNRLEHPDFLELQQAYAPEGGWKQSAEAWSTTRITVGADGRNAKEKDPTVQALGIGGTIYGTRADMLIADDPVSSKNVAHWEKQMYWLRREAQSRVKPGGKVIVIGTRIAPMDLYSELNNPDHYANGKIPWTYMKSPAILEERPNNEHVTLWPYATEPWQEPESDDECDLCDGAEYCKTGIVQEDGTKIYPRWDGLHLENGPRADNDATSWALIYQQTALNSRMTFPEHAVKMATNNSRLPGMLDADKLGHPKGGMHNMYVVGGCDPSIKGYAGIVVLAIDKTTLKRYLLTVSNMRAPTPKELKDEMKRLTEHYGINEWRVEKTGLLMFFTQDEELRAWMTHQGVIFKEHLTTGQTKWDPSFGVASMGSLFGAYERQTDDKGRDAGDWRTISEPIIELPRPVKDGVRALTHQLVTWTPETDPKRVPCDLVMALWFAETRAKEMTIRGAPGQKGLNPFKNALRFTSARDRKKRW